MTTPNDHPASLVTWHFYLDTDEGERRLRECLDAPKVLEAVWDFERWLKYAIDDCSTVGWDAPLRMVRGKLFECFLDNDVRVPGFE